ncbi:unnamed protein product [Citrullus colocynthis]|uniref:Uncharacterized protein n=1 Tax=Citrullus colocynthis TaxID=252529 RepID=A0ABP0XY49_9ROSI
MLGTKFQASIVLKRNETDAKAVDGYALEIREKVAKILGAPDSSDDQSEHLTNHDHSRQSPANQQHYASKSPKKSPTMVGLPPSTFHQPNCIIGNLAKVFPAFASSFFLILKTFNDKDYGDLVASEGVLIENLLSTS